jgi:hypothetical protein
VTDWKTLNGINHRGRGFVSPPRQASDFSLGVLPEQKKNGVGYLYLDSACKVAFLVGNDCTSKRIGVIFFF